MWVVGRCSVDVVYLGGAHTGFARTDAHREDGEVIFYVVFMIAPAKKATAIAAARMRTLQTQMAIMLDVAYLAHERYAEE